MIEAQPSRAIDLSRRQMMRVGSGRERERGSRASIVSRRVAARRPAAILHMIPTRRWRSCGEMPQPIWSPCDQSC